MLLFKKIDVYVKTYLAYVRSILEYSTYIWSSHKVGLINMIEKVQSILLDVCLLNVIFLI